MSATIYREEERQRGKAMAGPLAHLVDMVAYDLHNNESLHLHDAYGPVERCGYCYLRAGRTLGIVAQVLPSVAPQAEKENTSAVDLGGL